MQHESSDIRARQPQETARGLASDSDSVGVGIADGLPAGRRLYPYSVIPGGVESARELLAATHNDAVVAKHYADFDVDTARVIALDHDQAVYVSYRVGNNVYWTNRKIELHKGETLISDGTHEARTRCGNRVSETPQAPVAPAKQPALEAFDHFPATGELYATNLPIDGSLTAPPAFTPPGVPQPAETFWGFPPPFFPFVPGGGGPKNHSSVTPTSPSGPGAPSG